MIAWSPPRPREASRHAAPARGLAAIVSAFREFWHGYWTSPPGC